MMNEVKESLRSVEQKYKIFQQQQFTIIGALEHCRENAHDKIRPISSIGQVGARGQAGPGLNPLLEKLGKPRPREGQRVGAGIRSQILTVEEARHSFPHQLREKAAESRGWRHHWPGVKSWLCHMPPL